MDAVQDAVETAAECAQAALLVAERTAAAAPSVDSTGMVLLVAGAAGLLGEVVVDVRGLADRGSCADHLDHAAAALDAIPAEQRPAGLLLARAYLGDAQRAARQS